MAHYPQELQPEALSLNVNKQETGIERERAMIDRDTTNRWEKPLLK